ncbi:hypothetical protein BY996DRAFT_6614673 [Phakopsora pachyrhizi]|nr:hypothetical protein BY996DRAFT_6614673 [Phakopsora pachyrhizi]
MEILRGSTEPDRGSTEDGLDDPHQKRLMTLTNLKAIEPTKRRVERINEDWNKLISMERVGRKDLEERDGPGDSSTRAVLDAMMTTRNLRRLLSTEIDSEGANGREKDQKERSEDPKVKIKTSNNQRFRKGKDKSDEKTSKTTVGLQMSKRLLKMNVLLHQMKNLIQRRLMMRLESSLDKISEEDDQAKVLSILEMAGAETGTYERYEHTRQLKIIKARSRKLIMKSYNDEAKNFVEQEEEEGRSRKAHSQILRKTRARAGGGVLLRLWHIPKYGGNGSSLWIRVRVFNLIFKTAKSTAGRNWEDDNNKINKIE